MSKVSRPSFLSDRQHGFGDPPDALSVEKRALSGICS